MADFTSVDAGVGTGLFLFTGAGAIGGDMSMAVELISKFGVVAVLWFWVLDMRKRVSEQNTLFQERLKQVIDAFEQDTKQTREDYERILQHIKSESQCRTDYLIKLVDQQKEELSDLKSKLFKTQKGA